MINLDTATAQQIEAYATENMNLESIDLLKELSEKYKQLTNQSLFLTLLKIRNANQSRRIKRNNPIKKGHLRGNRLQVL